MMIVGGDTKTDYETSDMMEIKTNLCG
jgi:hypothetical protein